MRITRLGQGVDASGRLDPAAIERTVAVLREYREVMDRFGVEKVRMTRHLGRPRRRQPRRVLLRRRGRRGGARPSCCRGEEEGRLSFLGATADLDPADGPFLVFDIGGGSTEFTYGTTEAEATISTDIGCVRITEAWLHGDPPTAEELSQALSIIDIHLDDVVREIPQAAEAATFVGLAGTVSTAAAVELGLADLRPRPIHHFVLTKAAVEDVFRTLATESLADRIHNPGLERERADVIVGGHVRAGVGHAPPGRRRVPGVRVRHPRRPRHVAWSATS